ncbi:MAG: T9SS type A sorting domain-containing protein [Bacteroidetes bacterium]|nr:T9SS type A sorting domain-containing protein [Bacteroidota bacterium]
MKKIFWLCIPIKSGLISFLIYNSSFIISAQGTWTQKANFGGTARYLAVGFSIGTKGYIGTGYDYSGSKQDFWEWDQVTNTWTQKINFSGTARNDAVGFSIGLKGYIGTGSTSSGMTKDFWEYCDTCTGAGVNEIENQFSISVFPNTSNGKFTVSCLQFPVKEIMIYNLSGKLVYHATVNSKQETINLSAASGVYFYQLSSPSPAGEGRGEVATGKLIIE